MKIITAIVLAASTLLLCVSCGLAVTDPYLNGTDGTKDAAAPAPSGDTETGIDAPAEVGDRIVFTTETIDGEKVRSSDFSDAKLIMVNFFEPWCGPCIREMPDLEKLRSDYESRGLVILGVFYTAGADDSVREAVADTGVTYPVLRGCSELIPKTTDYVPTTFFMDGEGRVVGEQIIGAQSYGAWASVVESLLG